MHTGASAQGDAPVSTLRVETLCNARFSDYNLIDHLFFCFCSQFSALDKYLGQVLARTAPQLAGRKEEGVLLAQPPSTPESIADWGDADVYGVAFAVQGQGGTGAEGTGMSGAGVSPREAGPGMGRGAGALLGTSLEWPGSWRDLWRRVQHGAIGAPCVAGLFTRPAAATGE